MDFAIVSWVGQKPMAAFRPGRCSLWEKTERVDTHLLGAGISLTLRGV